MDEKLIFDASGAIFGRMATTVTKELLKGSTVEVINCEKIIISGDGKNLVKKIYQKIRMGQGSSLKGPKYTRKVDLLVKRMIRGMLPWDRSKGRESFKRLRCYEGDKGLSEEKMKTIKKFDHKLPRRYVTFEEVVKMLKNE